VQHRQDLSKVTFKVKQYGICISMVLFQPHKARLTFAKKYLHPDEEEFFISGQSSTGLELVHGVSESCQEQFHLCAGANRKAQKIWQGREDAPNFDSAIAQCGDNWSYLAAKIDHHEIRVRWDITVTKYS
jgi:hypothetical protein